jgi:hypothetical protein
MFVSQNTSPYLAEIFVSTDKHGSKFLVVVVRATFVVHSDGTTSVSEEQSPFVFADIHYGDPQTTAVQCETDFVPFKPRAEVLLNANAVAPSGRFVERCEVGLYGSGLKKIAMVTGERYWLSTNSGIVATRPQPFQSLPLGWHLSFGGSDNTNNDYRKHSTDLRNPIGVGFHINTSKDTINGLQLPCVEHPRNYMRIWSDRPEPIGFGPVSRFAESRAKFAGTYNQKWMDEVLPFLPDDFDDRYYQAAPLDQQLDTLHEGMEFMCTNMNAEGKFYVRIPTLKVMANFHFDNKTVKKIVKPDTLIMEPHNNVCIMVGRASVSLPRKFTKLREVKIEQSGPDVTVKPNYENLSVTIDNPDKLKAIR